MEDRKNLKRFNQVRKIAQTINNEGFKREYQNIIVPILEKYQKHICSDDEMLWQIDDAIKKIHHLAINYQYIPCQLHSKKQSNYSFDDHGKLFELEKLTKQLLGNNLNSPLVYAE